VGRRRRRISQNPSSTDYAPSIAASDKAKSRAISIHIYGTDIIRVGFSARRYSD
jgi:hypothetical protein